MNSNICSIFLDRILKKEYLLLLKIYKIERIKNKNLIQQHSIIYLEKLNKKLTKILEVYSFLEKKREYYIQKILHFHSIQRTNFLIEIKNRNLLEDKKIQLLDSLIKAIKRIKLKIDFLNQTNQDMIKNSLKWIEYSLDMKLVSNQKIIDFKV